MRTRGSMGWAFLVIVLAVPAVMYYKSYMAKDREAKLADKAKVRVPEGPLFPESADSQKFKNPISSDPAAPSGERGTARASEDLASQGQAPGSGAVVSTETASQTAAAVVDAAAPSDPAPVDASGAVTPAPPSANAMPEGGGDARPPASTASLATPAPPQAPEIAVSTADLVAVDWRDPLLSPYDQFLLEQEELEKLIKRKEVEEQALRAKVQRDKPVEQTLSLQGIVTTPEGNKAIINNDMYSEGEWIGNSGIKVLKISQTGVTFTHKGKAFLKRMQ
ncbi:MAG: hypothetical protein HZB91_08385 [Elusimicrobia bacterium]|nr:hypothetical protein [Elusimicrobiota bacterium]